MIEIFGKHLENISKPLPPRSTTEDENELCNYQEASRQLDFLTKNIDISENRNISKKAPGFELNTAKILQKVTPNYMKILTFILCVILMLRLSQSNKSVIL